MEVASLQAIFQVLAEAEVRYLVAGGVAVNGYGFLRYTKDIDLVVQLTPDNLRRALKALYSIGYKLTLPVSIDQASNPSQLEEWRTEKGMIVMQLWSDIHRSTPVDIFITEPFAFDDAYEKAPIEEISPGIPSRLVPIDQLIEMKRIAGREDDLKDIRNLIIIRDQHGKS